MNEITIDIDNVVTQLEKNIIDLATRNLILLFEISNDMVCIVGTEYLISVNAKFCQALGYTAYELKAVPWVNFIHPDDVAASLEAAELLHTDILFEFTHRFRHKDGHYINLAWTATPWQDNKTYAIVKVKP